MLRRKRACLIGWHVEAKLMIRQLVKTLIGLKHRHRIGVFWLVLTARLDTTKILAVMLAKLFRRKARNFTNTLDIVDWLLVIPEPNLFRVELELLLVRVAA
jgi:hypothetical protein